MFEAIQEILNDTRFSYAHLNIESDEHGKLIARLNADGNRYATATGDDLANILQEVERQCKVLIGD